MSRADHLKKHQFKPGQSGHPEGRPQLSPEARALKKLTLKRYRKVIKIALTGTYKDLKKFAEDETNSTVELGVARLLIRAINKGDTATFETFTGRIVGKIPDVIEISGEISAKHKVKVDVKLAKEMIEKCRSKV